MLYRALVWTRRLIDLRAIARGLGHLALIGSLLYLPFLLALDHHGAERIPTHQHLSADGHVPPHVHGFEVPHVDINGVSLLGRVPTVQISSESTRVLLALLTSTALAFVGASLGRRPSAPRYLGRAGRRDWVAQASYAPPTPPPLPAP